MKIISIDMSELESPYRTEENVLYSESFIKRSNEIKDFLSRIKKKNVILIWGHRRVGKTVFVRDIYLNRLDDSYIPIYIDGRAIYSESKSLSNLSSETFKTTIMQINKFLLYNDFVPKQVSRRRDHINDLSPKGPYSFNDFLSDMKKIQKWFPNSVIVLFIDEIDRIILGVEENKVAKEFLESLATLPENISNIKLVFIGGTKLKYTRARFEDALYSKLRVFELFSIQNFSRVEAKNLIELPIKKYLDYEDGLPDMIFEAADGQPWIIQDICDQLFLLKKEQNSNNITKAEFNTLASKIVGPDTPIETPTASYFGIMWNLLYQESTGNKPNKTLILALFSELLRSESSIKREEVIIFARSKGLAISDRDDFKKDLDQLIEIGIIQWIQITETLELRCLYFCSGSKKINH